jgi:hypothetical protein
MTNVLDQPSGVPQLNEDGHLEGTIIARHGLLADMADIVLAAGEMGFSTDTFKLALGDGSNNFAALAGLTGDSTATICVRALGTPIENGTALLSAYAIAKTLTPNGMALGYNEEEDVDVRASVIIFPGLYELPSALILDNAYVDLLGVSKPTCKNYRIKEEVPDYSAAYIYADSYTNGVINNTYDSEALPIAVYLRNLVLKYYTFPVKDRSLCQSCVFESPAGSNELWNGIYIDCIGAFSGEASGIFIGCMDRQDGESAAFASGGTANGIFIDCIGGDDSFGGNEGTASGKFIRCQGGSGSFGGGGNITSTARLYYCIADAGSYGTKDGSAKAFFCVNGDVQYTGND